MNAKVSEFICVKAIMYFVFAWLSNTYGVLKPIEDKSSLFHAMGLSSARFGCNRHC